MPEMHFVDSSNVEAIGYDEATQEVYVRFLKSGATYVYCEVASWVFEEFFNSPSKGGYVNSVLKVRYACYKL